jgi:hypothetical protein
MTPTTPSFFEAQLPTLLSSRRDAPAFWMLDILWIPLLEAHQTGGLFSVTEQWMPKDSGAHIKHVHKLRHIRSRGPVSPRPTTSEACPRW